MAGIMDPHYFLSKSDILGWINETLGTRLTKGIQLSRVPVRKHLQMSPSQLISFIFSTTVEECASGAIACQIMDALHPGVVQFKKVVSQ